MPLGSQASQVSKRDSLLKDFVTAGEGEPTHTPEVPAQIYVDVTASSTSTVVIYFWYEGAWTSPKVTLTPA